MRVRRDEIDGLLELTFSSKAQERARAVQQLCPCRVRRNEPRVWERVIEMTGDPDAKVRSHVLHVLADGSPRELESEVVAAIEGMMHDPDVKLRRRVRKLISQYRRSGNINVL